MTHLLETDTCIGVLRQRPGMMHLLIAGQAVAGGLTLVTNNVREFQRVIGIELESWP